MTSAASAPSVDLGPRARRACPVCGSTDDGVTLYPERLDPQRMGAMSYASRKEPEYMSLRMVVCPSCDLLYAPVVPSAAFLGRAYAQAGYDSDAEAHFAAISYAAAIRRKIHCLPDLESVLEIGSGNGALLGHLQSMGFTRVMGIEPSVEAIQSAAPSVRPLIRLGTFDAGDLPAERFSLVIANQTVEHVDDPQQLMVAAQKILKPGGAIMIVSHDYRHWLMRLLGRRSPIIDVEHLQIFSTTGIKHALGRAGFYSVEVRPFSNSYPLYYWMRLLPLPAAVKTPVQRWLRAASNGVGGTMINLKVGNFMAWAHALRAGQQGDRRNI